MRYFTTFIVLGMMVAFVGNANANMMGTDCAKMGPKGSPAYTNCEQQRALRAQQEGKMGKAEKHERKAQQSQQMGQMGY